MKGFDVSNMLYMILPVAVSAIFIFSWTTFLGEDMPGRNGEHKPLPDTVIFKLSEPQVTEGQLVAYLQQNAGFKLKGKASAFYEFGLLHDIDPAFALAVSRKETSLGKFTCGGTPMACNNFFCLRYDAVRYTGLTNGVCGSSEWASFETVDKGIEAFFIYIEERYAEKTPYQDSVSKIGCEQGSGFDNNCYCLMSGSGCDAWATEVYGFVKEIRKQKSIN